EIEISSRHKQPLSLLMLDIDHFKKVNDEYGHHTGDDVLKTVAQSLKAQLRNIDRVFRYGGEEFVVILSNTGATAAELIGERLRQACLNWEAAVFTGAPDLGKRMGIRSHKQYSFWNGALPCKLLLIKVTPDQFVTGERRTPEQR
ncbi:Diguanylate cyclase, partial [Pseudomonas syringae pv. maculicola]